MILLIGGATHSGKTALAQQLLETLAYPYLSIDHLKMGLIRSGQTSLTAEATDAALTNYLWPIVVEMIKTAIENKQHLIVEGVYIPFDYRKWFDSVYLKDIQYVALALTPDYIRNHFDTILAYENIVEARQNSDDLTIDELILANTTKMEQAIQNDLTLLKTSDVFDLDDMVKTICQQLRQ
ncbi:MAG: adenylate kinase [Streptococcaceae bacterium]|jgi:2-phosphoglycerate kinase|nr:adenylate kinase [Streptococcaceae bacterium]